MAKKSTSDEIKGYFDSAKATDYLRDHPVSSVILGNPHIRGNSSSYRKGFSQGAKDCQNGSHPSKKK